MAITFTPSICESLSIPVSSWDIHHTGGYVQVKFRATLDVKEFQRLGLGLGSKLQVWSDFSSDGGEWSEMDFEVDDQDGNLSCVFNVPFPLLATRDFSFSFTYRISHHHHHASPPWVEWLGSYAQNGVVRIYLEEENDSQALSPVPALVLGQGWLPSSSSRSSSLSCSSRQALTVKDTEGKWRLVLAVGRDGYSTSTTKGEASMSFLVPTRDDRDSRSLLIRPQIQLLAVAAGPESALLFSHNSGDIEVTTVSSDGGESSVVVLQAFRDSDSDVDSTWDSLVRHSFNLNQNRPRLVSLDDGKRIVALASSPQIFPIELTLFPLTRWRDEGVESKELGLASLIGVSGALAMFSESEPTPNITTLNDNSDSLPVLKPVKLSPFTPLSTNDNVSICVLTPHQSNNLDLLPTVAGTDRKNDGNGDEDAEALPTPPPSPQLRPISHLKGGKGNESTASISDIGILSRVDTPAERSNSRLDLVSVSSSSSSSSRSGSSEVLKRPPGLIACLGHFLFASSFFLIILVRRVLFGGGGGRKDSSSRRWGIGSGTARYHSPSGSGYVTPNRESGQERRVDGTTAPLLSGTSQSVNDDGNEVLLPSPERKLEPDPVVVTLTSAPPLATPNVLYFTRSFDLLDTASAINHAVVLRGIVDFKLTDKVKFEVDDQPIGIRDVKSIQGEPDVLFVELEWRKSGQLTVTYCA
ncbi:hypothetical protein E1B28_001349 [Marasmius oreades]|uniref:Uncharacterized protein n=1 Tax=Marasmius oreades TaxID=181124 RepID=A0A9P7V385_9AGAR|nr:uncharacterized protein E1B28_001349 [Marasmius oreades]KAG7099503.1 hypothetical protein E1B28_001349 [Marasmius oreades]